MYALTKLFLHFIIYYAYSVTKPSTYFSLQLDNVTSSTDILIQEDPNHSFLGTMNFHTSLNRFSHLRKRIQRLLANLRFLQLCKNTARVPKSFQLTCHLPTSPRISKALLRCHRILITAKIQDLRSQIALAEEECYILHLQLAQLLGPTWNKYDAKSYLEAQHEGNLIANRQQIKYHHLEPHPRHLPLTSPTVNQSPTYVINYSHHNLSHNEIALLNKGLNFNCSTREDPLPIIATIENSIKNSELKTVQKHNLRRAVADRLQPTDKPRSKSNISSTDQDSINSLNDKDVVICKSDKGNRCVILDRSQYNDGLQTFLSSPQYLPLTNDPLLSQTKRITAAIKTNPITKDLCFQLSPRRSHHGRFYVAPKTHKPTLTFRPVLSTINTPPAKLSRFLVKLLTTKLTTNPYVVRNSQDFVSRLHDLSPSVPMDSILISLDIESLYTNVPRDDALTRLRTRLEESFCDNTFIDNALTLTTLCIDLNTFQANNVLYSQTEGLPMGSSLSPLLADNYLLFLEREVFSQSHPHILPWMRYVDDTFLIWSQGIDSFNTFFNYLNLLDPHITFTKELEQNNQLPFLDVLVTKDPLSDKLGFLTSVYRKPHSVPALITSTSQQPLSQKIGTIYGYVHRAINLTNSTMALQRELNFLRDLCTQRGYTPILVDRAYKKYHNRHTVVSNLTSLKEPKKPLICLPASSFSTRISQVLRPHFQTIYRTTHKLATKFPSLTDPIDISQQAGIYIIPCECQKVYIGQTVRNFKERLKEHQADIKHGRFHKSALAKHAMDTDHTIAFHKASVRYHLLPKYHLDTLEALTIHIYGQTALNDRTTTVSNTWLQSNINTLQ